MNQQPTDIDDMGKLKHKLHGKRGPWLEARCRDGEVRYYAWQHRGEQIVRGADRKGIKAADLSEEAVWENELTSPRIEVPRVVIETVQMDIKMLSAQDVAIYWRLFAEARLQGIAADTHTIEVAALKAFLDVDHKSRIVSSLKKLAQARMSLHVNQTGAHGRVGMQMLEAVAVAGDIVTFSLPSVLCTAALAARDYAWVDINAIARFESKFTTALYMKLCLEAGKHWSKRSAVEDTRVEFRDRVGLPEATRLSVIEDTLNRVRADILAISGPRRRFDVKFALGGVDDRIEVVAGNAAKKLKELKPKALTRAALVQVVESNRGPLAVAPRRYPALVRLRQAATLLNAAVISVADAWRMDIHGAISEPTRPIAGLAGSDFLGLIDKYGADDVLEYWADKRDFSIYPAFRGMRVAVDVGVARVIKKKTPVLSDLDVNEPEENVADEYMMSEDFGVLDYGAVEAAVLIEAADIDDCDIPF